MKNKVLLQLLLSFSCFSNVDAEIHITEIMTNNVSTIVSDKYNYDGYVEFYNDGHDVDLKGWTVTNLKGDQVNWSVLLDSSHVLPNGYSILFFGKEESSSRSATRVQNNYAGSVGQKLSTDEGVITLSKDGQKLELPYPKQYPHIAYCENGFMIPTPGKMNDNLVTTISNRAASPNFKNNKPGLYENKLSVELGCETEGAQIYYTLNGDVPTPENGKRYDSSISIEQTTVIRARAYKDGMLFSETLTGSFILPDKYYEACKGVGERLPVVSISANNEDIFGDMLGMYVEGTNGIVSGCYDTPANYNQDWMRSANFEYILDGKVVDNQEVEIGVYGGCTRIHVAKSLKIKANKRSGKSKMQYDNFFPARDYKKYKSLALRNGGNGYSYVQPRWRDMFIQSLADGMNLDRQMAQPVAYYLNGTFYGMMILTERANEDYVYHNYGLDEDEIDFLSVGAGYECEAGTKDAYNSMIDYVSKNNTAEDFYDKLGRMMDIDEYIDYQILEQYIANTDWVSNNIKLWRNRDGGKFRWIVFDTDFGLSKATSVDKDMIKFATSEKGGDSMWILLKSCLNNEDFRWRFLDQYLDRIENQFAEEKIDSKLDSIWDLTRLDMCATIKNAAFLGAPGNPTVYDETVELMRSFAKERKVYVIDQLKKEFGLGDDTVTIKIRTVFPNDETPDFKFLINKREINSLKYNTWRYSGERMKIEPIIPAGYKIQRWAINDTIVRNDNNGKYLSDVLVTTAKTKELKVTMYFEYDNDCVMPMDLYLNEVCASNTTVVDEKGNASDWIEIYNGGDRDIDLAGMMVENVSKAVKCTIPRGFEETVVPAHGYKLLWADKNPDRGPLHLNFKLSATVSETIKLSYVYRDSEFDLSAMVYVPHGPNESFGRVSDGLSDVGIFEKCVDSEGKEVFTSTPLAANGSMTCESGIVEEIQADDSDIHIYTHGRMVVLQNMNIGSMVEVYSILGAIVAKKTVDSDAVSIIVPAPGIYIVKVGSECRKIVVE